MNLSCEFPEDGEVPEKSDCQQADFLLAKFSPCLKKQTGGWVGVLDTEYLEIIGKSGWLRWNFPLTCFPVYQSEGGREKSSVPPAPSKSFIQTVQASQTGALVPEPPWK